MAFAVDGYSSGVKSLGFRGLGLGNTLWPKG